MRNTNKLSSKSNKKSNGFSLIELLISVAIIGILGAIAFPSYTSFVSKSNRSEALRELNRLANLQEQAFIDRRTYTATMTDLGMSTDPYITNSGDYSIDAVIANAGNTFVLTATAQGTQATNDSGCVTITINEVGQKTPASCWE